MYIKFYTVFFKVYNYIKVCVCLVCSEFEQNTCNSLDEMFLRTFHHVANATLANFLNQKNLNLPISTLYEIHLKIG